MSFYALKATDDRASGWHTVIANVNSDAVGYGPAWGTFSLDVDAYDGYWEGSYTGMIDENGISLKMRGRGFGELSGLRIEGTYLNGDGWLDYRVAERLSSGIIRWSHGRDF